MDAEAEDALGLELWWTDRLEESHQHRRNAYEGFKRLGDHGRAAKIAAWLAREQVFLHGDGPAAEAWFARAEALIDAAHPSAAGAWVHLLRASLSAGPAELGPICEIAIQIGETADDPSLRAVGHAYRGLARIGEGKVRDGMAELDEAMTMVTTGEVPSREWMTEIFCVMLSACERVADYRRADHWCRVAGAHAEEWRSTFLAAMCRTTYGSVLAASGRWQEAERELVSALNGFERGHRALRIQALSRLVDLHLGQGRLAEARGLVRGDEDHPGLALPIARLNFIRGELEAARAVLSSAIDGAGAADIGVAPYHSLMIEVALGLNDLDGAESSAHAIAHLAELSESPVLRAEARLARARVMRSRGDAGAIQELREGLLALDALETSWLAARIRLELAELEEDRGAAIVLASSALATFERLGASRDVDRASQVLRRLGQGGRTGPRLDEVLTRRERQVLVLLAEGLSNPEIAERLYISPKTAEHHVSNILSKLGLRNRSEASAYAVRTAD